MKPGRRQLLGLVLAIFGVLGTIISCALPTWRSPEWRKSEGLWKSCNSGYSYYTTTTPCKSYDSLLDLPQDLQAAGVLIVIAIIVGIFGVMVGVVGGNCTTLVSNKRKNSKVAIASGITFIISGVLVIIPICWSTITTAFIARHHYDIYRFMGASLYIGWASAGLLLLGGSLLCCSCPCSNENDIKVEYSKPSSV
ncbi:claudin-4-like [Oreochromis aureus]|uniref:claudin-4-like n=1 Tax=Oreochromis aureus TaxID=47969 RepID=UPI0019547C16|nr:claudin-4-like [Oreochromis aureus]